MIIEPTVTLAEAPIIPEQYRDTVLQFLRAHWEGARWEMQEQFGFHNLPLLSNEQLLHSMLADTVAEIARCAAGLMNGNQNTLSIVAEGIQSIMESLFCRRSAGLYIYQVPEEFWGTPFGQMVAVARLHIANDELITIAQAAELLGVTTQAVSQAVNVGRLTAYVDPNAPAHQGRRLVSRRDVENYTKGDA